MDHNFHAQIIPDILTLDEVGQVYDEITNRPNQSYIMDNYSQKVTDFNMPEDIANKIIKICEDTYGLQNLQISAFQFARYANYYDEEGNKVVPILSPHWDDAFETPRLTFDYQIGGNTTWGISVEGYDDFILENNQAVCFGGTHQIHWRPHKTFRDDEYLDMIFVHLDIKNADKIERFSKTMSQKEPIWYNKYLEQINNDPDNFYGENIKNTLGLKEYHSRWSESNINGAETNND